PVRAYPPYVASDAGFDSEVDAAALMTPIRITYDALGRIDRIDQPDQTIERVEHGPWEEALWDANDTVLNSQWYAARAAPGGDADAAAASAAHAGTPQVRAFDALGRGYLTGDDNGAAGTYVT